MGYPRPGVVLVVYTTPSLLVDNCTMSHLILQILPLQQICITLHIVPQQICEGHQYQNKQVVYTAAILDPPTERPSWIWGQLSWIYKKKNPCTLSYPTYCCQNQTSLVMNLVSFAPTISTNQDMRIEQVKCSQHKST